MEQNADSVCQMFQCEAAVEWIVTLRYKDGPTDIAVCDEHMVDQMSREYLRPDRRYVGAQIDSSGADQ